MIKVAGFDLDGTLVYQPREYIIGVLQETFSYLSKWLNRRLTLNERFIDGFWYEADRDAFIENELGIPNMDFWNVFWKYDDPHERARNTEVYADVGALRNLYNKGIKLGIVTGCLTELAKLEIEKIRENVPDVKFDSIITNNPSEGVRQKPYPDTLLRFLQDVGVRSEEAVYVGNSRGDAQAATSAQIKPVIVLRERKVDLTEPLTIIHSLYELENIF